MVSKIDFFDEGHQQCVYSVLTVIQIIHVLKNLNTLLQPQLVIVIVLEVEFGCSLRPRRVMF